MGNYTVKRIATLEGETLCFMVFLGSRSRGYRTFEIGQVPPFEGKSAVFEVDRRGGRWVFLRQVG
jgi:hypothetical protein